MERVALAGLIVVLVLTLIWFNRKEQYTQAQSSNLFSIFHGSRYTGSTADNLKAYTIKSILGVDIGDDSSIGLSNVNLLVDTLNSNGFTFTHFSNINELNSMFETAYTSGESGLGTRERMILRTFAWPSVEIISEFSYYAISLNYTSDGVADFTNTIIAESGKTPKEMLRYCFTFIDKLFSTGEGSNPYTPEVIDYINSAIPSKYTQKFDRTDNMSIQNALRSSTPNETEIWFIKALMIGPAYLAWIAENKWKLDPMWNP
jgi:hypothetical protein